MNMNIFITGASGYIGGSVAAALLSAGHNVSGLVRSDVKADTVRALGIEPVLGSLDDAAVLAEAAARADVVINAANADHEASTKTLLNALENSGKAYIHTSGSSVVGTQAGGQRLEDVYDESTTFTPSAGRAARAALNEFILSYEVKELRPVIVCPSLIYGLGCGATEHSMQVPWLIETARKHGGAKHYGTGGNIWSNVHIDDLVDLYLLALKSAPSGAFYFAENGENSMRELCEAVNRMLGLTREPQSMLLQEAAAEWGEGAAQNTMGSNSRVRAVRARTELGWSPKAPSVVAEIEHGCYAISQS
jgi:nucleoside-diphosphate-sugar epimerase